jgi:hypothetical protein
METIDITTYDKTKKILGYAVCRLWADSHTTEVFEYADSKEEAKEIIRAAKRKLGKDSRYVWFIGVYQ